ncbi:hypothetical protein CVIRNUC_010956 [Coccomyxa viridis]|uniref:Uncharacterized protein n=1 Tax=Coccomyxa viridis TaxID=1274662 RepID=A0AAV1IKU9_9CHLO|nr:hypothetical protein CVIRNUC_010956 [Coccomyxa viridis]
MNSCGTQELPSQKNKDSSRAKLLVEAKKKVGSTPLEEAILQYPVETWRVWSSIHPRSYSENSEEFPEKLENLQRNAQEVRTWNAEHRGDPDEFLELNNFADYSWGGKTLTGVPGGLYQGSISYHGKVPSEQKPPPLSVLCRRIMDHAACLRAELLEEAKKKIGSTPLEEAILQYPVETWRVWSSTYPRKYTEDSEEFPKRLENLQKSAQIVRTWNARHSRQPDELLALNNTADRAPWSMTMPGVPGGLTPGSIPDHYKLPDEQELPLQKKDGFSRAELLEEAKKKIGSTPLEEAILQYPVETWRVWSSTYPRKYTEDSEEFPKRMEYLQKSAQEVRTWNATHRREPDQFLALNNTADCKVIPSVPGGLYPGNLPDHYKLPAGLMVD